MTDGLAYAGPLVRRLARELGVDLAQVVGTGESGRVQVEDVHRHVRAAVTRPVAIAVAMGHSSVEADITALEELRERFGAQGVAISRLGVVVKAVAVTLRGFPALGGAGCAIALLDEQGRRGVIGDADRTGLAALADPMASAPSDRAAGFTIVALPRRGLMPDVSPPALGVAAAEIRPVWDGQRFSPRLMQTLSLSWDRDRLDSLEAGRFLARLANVLEDITQILL